MKERLKQFMQGRYGADQLSRFGSILGLIIILAGLFTKVKMVLYIGWAIYIYFGIYRVFSKNITKRYNENIKYMDSTKPLRDFFGKIKGRFKGMKDYKYLKCPNCKKEMKIPKVKGKVKITCPHCKNKFIKKL